MAKCPEHVPVRVLMLAGGGEHPPTFACVSLPRKNLTAKIVMQETAKVRAGARFHVDGLGLG